MESQSSYLRPVTVMTELFCLMCVRQTAESDKEGKAIPVEAY
jgi:hypothetical protein